LNADGTAETMEGEVVSEGGIEGFKLYLLTLTTIRTITSVSYSEYTIAEAGGI
jgi:hypothetical protein